MHITLMSGGPGLAAPAPGPAGRPLPIWMLAGGPSAGVPAGPATHGSVITRGLGTPYILTRGYAPGIVTTSLGSVITRGLGTGYLITRGYRTATSGVPGDLPGTFIAAVRRALMADGVLNAMLPGKVWHRFAPRGVPEPVLVFIVVPTARATSTTDRDYHDSGQVQLTVYGPRDSVAVAAVNRAMAVLTDAKLKWRTGATFLLRPSDVSSPDLPKSGYGGAKVFGEVRLMDFKNYGNFALA